MLGKIANNSKCSLKISLLDKILGNHMPQEYDSIEHNFINKLEDNNSYLYKLIINTINNHNITKEQKEKQIISLLEQIDNRVDTIELKIIKSEEYTTKLIIIFNIKSNSVQGFIRLQL